MNGFKIINGQVVGIVTSFTDYDPAVVTSWDIESIVRADQIAAGATELTGEKFIATDAGEWVAPRFDIVRAPAIGDAVSYGFNGDIRPCGTIVKITHDLRIVTTSDGRKFYRRKQSGAWISGGIWSLVFGHIDERNPHF